MSGSDMLAAYREQLMPMQGPRGTVDELLDGTSPVDEAVRRRVSALGSTGLSAKAATIRGFVADDGITYGTVPDGTRSGPWRVDPLPMVMDGATWAALEEGLRQRATLLNHLLKDIYGSQTLIRDGVVPADVIVNHPEFLPDAVGTLGERSQPLVLPSADLARSATGDWVVLGDRAQAPSGAGYAMADRRLVARTFPWLYRDAALARLRTFFDRLGSALNQLCNHDSEDDVGKVVLLSPGSASETAFDQALTASLLGVPVVQAEDLLVADGHVWWRTGTGDERVDVIVRRVDSTWSDPLDLRSGSQLGVPGLLEAARSGMVTLVNPLGAGVLENPALNAYLPRLSEEVLAEPLLLPGPPTWWCGDPDQLNAAAGRLESLVIKSAVGQQGTRLGWLLSDQDRAQLREAIAARPWEWVLQEPVTMSTVPVVARSGIEPRRFVLRTFGVAVEGGYEFMPGGLGRVSEHLAGRLISSATGGPAKDVWVHSETAPTGPDPVPARHSVARHPVAPRAADDLFWMGRYAERAESVVRLLLVIDDLTSDYLDGPVSPGQSVLQVMLDAASDLTGATACATAADGDLATITSSLVPLVFDGRRPGTVAFAVEHLVQDGQASRDLLSGDTWLVLSRMQRALGAEAEMPLQPTLAELLESLLALSGLTAEAMLRGPTWAFVECGRRIERALQTIALLRRTICTERPPVTDGQVTEAVLRVADSLRSHHRRLSTGVGPAAPVASAVDLLLLDVDNPRSVAFQLDRLTSALSRVGGLADRPIPMTSEAVLDAADADALCLAQRRRLQVLLHEVDADLRSVSDRIEARYFARPLPHRTMAAGDLVTGGVVP